MPGFGSSSLDNVIHVIQVALTPVFLLTALAALLNVFSTRLGRVADRVDQVAAKLQSATATDAEFFSNSIGLFEEAVARPRCGGCVGNDRRSGDQRSCIRTVCRRSA